MPARARERRPSALRRRELSCLIAAVLASGAAVEQATAREVPFAEPPAITTDADGAWSVFAADLDGDGDLDALSASRFDGKIAWYENDGTVGAWTIHTITTAAEAATSVFAADVDGDGDLDALSAFNSDVKIAWYENDGTGSTWTLHTISKAGLSVRSVFAADVDGDGDIDALSASRSDDKIAWYENVDDDGSSWTTHTITTTASGAYSVFAADVDGDGDLDALSASEYDDKIAWYENDGTGSGWTIHTISTTAGRARSVFAADVDGDGDLDPLSASLDDNKIAWYENDGTGSGWTIHTISTTASTPRSVFAADVDGDGDLDTLSASGVGDTIAWYENDGSGISWTLHAISPNAFDAHSVFAADLDGDGDIDALSASAYDDKIAWYRNDTIHRSARFPAETVISDAVTGARNVSAGDMNADGFIDVLSTSFNQDMVTAHLSDGTGTGWLAQTVSTSVDGAHGLFVTDIDGDGDLDVASTAYGSPDAILWHENDGTAGGWTLHTIQTSGVSNPPFVSAADVDGDGDTDVFSEYGSQLSWFENAGSGSSWTLHTIPNVTGGPSSVFPADMDRDGDPDALFTEGNTVAWSENDGSGGFATLHTVTTTASGARDVFAADVDGDGDLDAVSASANDNKVAWYENTAGDGSAWGIFTVTTDAGAVNSVLVHDLDGDGDVDIAATSAPYDTITWYENTAGDGSAWSRVTITTTADAVRALFSADVDGDGDRDLLAASFDDATIAWYENQGGQFALPTLTTAQKIVNNSETHDLLDIEAVHRGRTGDSDAELVTLELKLTDGSGTDLTSTEANNLIEELRIHLDDGSGEFDGAPTDTVVHTVSAFSLTNGVETITFDDGNANAQLPFGNPKIYFAVADLTADADSQTPSAFQLTHLTESSSTGEDAAADIPLTLEFWPDTGTGVVDTTLDSTSCEAPFDLLLSDRTVTTAVSCQAGTFIRAGDAFVVDSGGDLSLSAGETIRFTSGFHVDEGTLSVTIDPVLSP